MALLPIFNHKDFDYTALSTDISLNKIAGLDYGNAAGSRIYITDSKVGKVVNPDYTLSDYIINSDLQVGDIQIGAVEIKDATTDTRAVVGANGLYTDIRNIQAGSNIIGKVGIDQTTDGTTNLVVVKQSTHDNLNLNANVQVGNADVTPINQVNTNVTKVEASVVLTIASGGLYTANDIINNSTDSTLPAIDFSTAFGSSLANREIQINSVQIRSSNGAATTKLIPELILYNANTLTGSTLTDSTQFNPTEAQHALKKVTAMSKSENWNLGDFAYGNFYEMRLTEIIRNAKLDANGKLYLALIATNAYTSATNEVITVTIKGYLLN